MSRWTDIGYKWSTRTTYRVREFLKENGIHFRMPSDEMFFQSMYHLPHRDWIWGIKVRKKDLTRILSLLEKEGFMRRQHPATTTDSAKHSSRKLSAAAGNMKE